MFFDLYDTGCTRKTPKLQPLELQSVIEEVLAGAVESAMKSSHEGRLFVLGSRVHLKQVLR